MVISNKPVVSVIISFLNAERFIQESIESVFAQTFEDWELLLVDDGSSDFSSLIARRYVERYPQKVSYYEHNGHHNRGQAASRNLGMNYAKGQYIAPLDADDVWLPYKLEQQVKTLDSNPEVAMVFGCTQYWQSWTGNPEDMRRDFVRKPGVQVNTVYEPPNLLVLSLSGKAAAPPPSDLLFRREVIQRLGGFEEAFRGIYGMYEDQAFLVKIFLNRPVFVANECWDRYRLHPDSFCAVQIRAGRERAIRLFYLNWLVQYLALQHVNDSGIWRSVRRMLWPYHHPLLARLLRPGVRSMRYIKSFFPILNR